MSADRLDDPRAVWSRLVAYYRSCIVRESGFADLLQRRSDGSRYVFLRGGREPLLCDPDGSIDVDARIAGLIHTARRQSESLYYGYPVVLLHETKGGVSRRKLAPLFVYELAIPERGTADLGPLLPVADEPFLYAAVLAQFGYRDEQQAKLIQSIDAESWLGDAASVREEVGDLLSAIGIPGVEEINPDRLGSVPEGEIDGIGAHNIGMIFRAAGSTYNTRLLSELDALRDAWPRAQHTAASLLLRQLLPSLPTPPESPKAEGGATPEIAAPLPINDSQRSALYDAMDKPLTVVTGPPGTG